MEKEGQNGAPDIAEGFKGEGYYNIRVKAH
jgi:hypothetical protein